MQVVVRTRARACLERGTPLRTANQMALWRRRFGERLVLIVLGGGARRRGATIVDVAMAVSSGAKPVDVADELALTASLATCSWWAQQRRGA